MFNILFFISVNFLFSLNCENTINFATEDYCLAFEWDFADKILNDKLTPINELSPVLNEGKTKPKEWMYSKLNIFVWKKSDISQKLLNIKNLAFFPYMEMENGHNHSTSHGFFSGLPSKSYILEGMNFTSMKGCWAIYFRDEVKNISQRVMSILHFNNIDELTNKNIADLCQ